MLVNALAAKTHAFANSLKIDWSSCITSHKRRTEMSKAFPKQIVIKWEDGGSEPAYMVPYRDLVDTAEMGQKTVVGVYTLTETVEVKGVAITNTVKKTRSVKNGDRT